MLDAIDFRMRSVRQNTAPPLRWRASAADRRPLPTATRGEGRGMRVLQRWYRSMHFFEAA
jgi:hypothetical protein